MWVNGEAPIILNVLQNRENLVGDFYERYKRYKRYYERYYEQFACNIFYLIEMQSIL